MIDQKDDALLKSIHDKELSFQELADLVGLAVSTTHRRIWIMVDMGLIDKQGRGKHRTLSLTEAGRTYLEKNGLI